MSKSSEKEDKKNASTPQVSDNGSSSSDESDYISPSPKHHHKEKQRRQKKHKTSSDSGSGFSLGMNTNTVFGIMHGVESLAIIGMVIYMLSFSRRLLALEKAGFAGSSVSSEEITSMKTDIVNLKKTLENLHKEISTSFMGINDTFKHMEQPITEHGDTLRMVTENLKDLNTFSTNVQRMIKANTGQVKPKVSTPSRTEDTTDEDIPSLPPPLVSSSASKNPPQTSSTQKGATPIKLSGAKR